jgi:hypothetical protein
VRVTEKGLLVVSYYLQYAMVCVMVGSEGSHNNMQELASMGWMDAINWGSLFGNNMSFLHVSSMQLNAMFICYCKGMQN